MPETRQQRRKRKRQERRAARRDRGLVRPGPVRVRVANLASVSSNRDQVRAILRASLTVKPLPDLVLAVECSDLTLAEHVGPDWQVLQSGRDETNPDQRAALSGSALIARRTVATLDHGRLREGSPAGEGIRTRYALTARARFHRRTLRRWRALATVGHAPPGRAPTGRARFLEFLAGIAGIRGGDYNIRAGDVRRRFTLTRNRSAGLMHLQVPFWIPASPPELVEVGSDHKALDVVLFPPRRRNR